MKRFLCILCLAVAACQSCALADIGELRPYVPIVLKKGAFLKAVNQRQISTAIADEGDEVTLIAPTDIWCGETKIIPRNSIFSGVIEELHEPVQGTNASMKIKINKVTLPNNTELPIAAYVINNGSSTLGGELTQPLEYTRIPHYIYYPRVYKGVLQIVPGNKRFFGQHLVIKPGAEFVLMLDEDFNAIDADF